MIDDYIKSISVTNVSLTEYLNQIKPMITKKLERIEQNYYSILDSCENIMKLLEYDNIVIYN